MTDTLAPLRHGHSQANAEVLFTGLLDVPLTETGRREALHAAPPSMSRLQRVTLGSAPGSLRMTESLHQVINRVTEVWHDGIEPAVRQTGAVLVVARSNSLRAQCVHLKGLDAAEIRDLNIPTGHPLVYRIDHQNRPLLRGGSYLDRTAATAAAAPIAREGGT